MTTNDSSLATSEQWLISSVAELVKAGIGTARLDCLILLEEVLSKDRTHLLAHPETQITTEQLKRLAKMVQKRIKHIPIAQILGRTEFFGREFLINQHVLEPRPESETMIELLLEIYNSQKPPLIQDSLVKDGRNVKWSIADVGAGSGALGITVALEVPGAHVDLFEIDDEALKVAVMNTKKHKLRVKCIKSDLLSAAAESYDVILANLPYVPDSYEINRAAANEPRIAIFGGADGLDLYKRLFDQVSEMKSKPTVILTESLPFQHHQLAVIARKMGYIQEKAEDFIQVFKLGL